MRQGWGPRGWRRRAAALLAALALGWAALPLAPVSTRHEEYFPDVRPERLAHYLADFSNHVLLYPRPESWAVEGEWRNLTSWHYEVAYSCGARCAGRATVTAHAAHGSGAPRHGAGSARLHRVLALDVRCTRLLPPLLWPTLCEETETDTLIVGEEGGEGGGAAGARLAERAAARCSRPAAALGRCADAGELAARHRLRLHALSAVLLQEKVF